MDLQQESHPPIVVVIRDSDVPCDAPIRRAFDGKNPQLRFRSFSHSKAPTSAASEDKNLIWVFFNGSDPEVHALAQQYEDAGFPKVFLAMDAFDKWLVGARENATEARPIKSQFIDYLRTVGKSAYVNLADINDRAGTRIRHIRLRHVVTLAGSIARQGCLNPITVDCERRLLAGEHRREALRLLSCDPGKRKEMLNELNLDASRTQSVKMSELDRLARSIEDLPVAPSDIKVHMMAFDSMSESQSAMAVEVSENEQRHDYSKEDIRRLMEVLKKKGASFDLGKGRPKAGVQPGVPILASMTGCSDAKILRALKDTAAPKIIATPKQRAWKSAHKALHQFLTFPDFPAPVIASMQAAYDVLDCEQPPVDQDAADDQ